MSSVAINGSYCLGVCKHKDHPIPIPVDGYVFCSRKKFTVEGDSIAIESDKVYSRCGHSGVLNSNLSSMTFEDYKVAKVGSVFTGDFSGVVVSGNSKMTVP